MSDRCEDNYCGERNCYLLGLLEEAAADLRLDLVCWPMIIFFQVRGFNKKSVFNWRLIPLIDIYFY